MGHCALSHVLVIPDGNRRYARESGCSLHDTYRQSANVVLPELLRFFLVEGRARQLTVYAISYHNLVNRGTEETDPILRCQAAAYDMWLHLKEFTEAGIRFRFAGDEELLPEYYRKAVRNLEANTRSRSGSTCLLLAAYDGERELLKAINRLVASGGAATIDSCSLLRHLDVCDPVDMVLRTGKEKRLSGVPLLPCSYAELIFVDQYFPALTRDLLHLVWADFQSRKRRFGA